MAWWIKRINSFEVVLFLLFLTFSTVIMWKTFGLDDAGNMQVATKAWSDFAATIPLIRSFSYGSNFPPEYPIFAGQPIRYHFVFYLFVGLLEKTGLPISWALNIPSILGFTLLLVAIYFLGKIVFKSKATGILSVILFLFNGSFSFLEFFKTHPLSANTLNDITASTHFSSFGPYDGKIVSAFWNLNIYTNQRHLALAYTVFIFLLIYLYKKAKSKNQINLTETIFWGITIGFFPFVHYPVFGMLMILLAIFFVFFANLRKQIFFIGLISLILAIPQILYMGDPATQVRLFFPGYLIQSLSTLNFLKYWLLNLGLTTILAPIGFLLANKDQRKILIPFIVFFIIGNLFKFSPEIAANHKFFNLFAIGINSFTAYFLVKSWRKYVFLKPIMPVTLLFLTLSGILDLFPIINDSVITIEDIPNNKTATYIMGNTSKSSVFLNSSYLYHPASLAGRKIYMGWPYFAWSAGYDTDLRQNKMKYILSSSNKTQVCNTLKDEGIDYIEIQKPTSLEGIEINYIFYQNMFKAIFVNSNNGITIYDVQSSCET